MTFRVPLQRVPKSAVWEVASPECSNVYELSNSGGGQMGSCNEHSGYFTKLGAAWHIYTNLGEGDLEKFVLQPAMYRSNCFRTLNQFG